MEPVQIALLALFVVILILLSLEVYNKAILTLTGAIFVYIILFITEGIKFEALVKFINFNVLAIFLSIMIIINIVTYSGFFQFIAVRTVKMTKGDLNVLYYVLGIITFITGMLLLNIVAVLMIASVTITIASALKTDSKNFLIMEVIAIDMGAMSLIFASIPNILISNIVGLSIAYFATYVLPFAILVVSIFLTYFPMFFKKFPEIDPLRKLALMELNEYNMIRDMKTLIFSGAILLYVIVGFAIFNDPAIIAVSAAILLIILTKFSVERLPEGVDWETFFFLIGLFIIVGSLEHVGIIKMISDELYPIIKSNAFLGMLLILWSAGILSGFLDNIALTLIYIPLLMDLAPAFGPVAPLVWIALILGTNLGGELTPIGSPTTLITMGFAKENGIIIEFKEFLFYGAIVSLLNLTIATIYIFFILYLLPNLTIIPFIALSFATLGIMVYFKIIKKTKTK
ncbi:MAG: SLC13 family permease [Candidatus Njordarchaeia archaeon]